MGEVGGGRQRHHRFGPMHHRREHKIEGHAAERELRTVANLNVAAILFAIKSLHHAESLFIANDLHVGIILAQQGNRTAVVGLHVVHHEVIDRSLTDDFTDIFEVLREKIDLNGVDEARFLVVDQVGIVAHAVGQRPQPFEQRFVAVVHTDVVNFLSDFHVVFP